MKSFLTVALVSAFLSAANAHAQPAEAPLPAEIRVKPLTSVTTTASGQPIVFPSGGARVIASEYEIAPGAALPPHHHPYPRIAYVLQGHLKVTDKDTGLDFAYKAGDVVIEVIGQRHFGYNSGAETIRLLVFDTVPSEVDNNVVIDN